MSIFSSLAVSFYPTIFSPGSGTITGFRYVRNSTSSRECKLVNQVICEWYCVDIKYLGTCNVETNKRRYWLFPHENIWGSCNVETKEKIKYFPRESLLTLLEWADKGVRGLVGCQLQKHKSYKLQKTLSIKKTQKLQITKNMQVVH